MNVNPGIFKAYDIRGIYPTDLDGDVAYRIGKAYAEILLRENPGKKPNIVVGYDMRISTPLLKNSVIKGLLNSGVNVIDVGLVSTPTFYFSVAYYNYDGGLQISASHNPKEHNGFKMTRKAAVAFSGETGINEIKDLVIKNEFLSSTERGILTQKSGVTEEAVRVERQEINYGNIKPFKIVVDAANAMGALDVDAIFKDLPCELIRINWELDGNFPSHQADPLNEQNLEQLKNKIKETGADLGIAPDGDGDRYFFVDEKGKTLRQDILRGFIAQLMLKKYPGAKVCYDVRPGRITREMIEAAGGIPLVNKVGHSLIKEFMVTEGSVFSGESSGHYFFKMPFGSFEAPTILVMMFLKFLTDENRPLGEIAAPYYKYFQSGEINSKVTDSKVKLEEIKEKYADGKQSFLDGISIEYPDFWFNVRASNTESLLRLNLEARTKELMEQKRDEVLNLIRS